MLLIKKNKHYSYWTCSW